MYRSLRKRHFTSQAFRMQPKRWKRTWMVGERKNLFFILLSLAWGGKTLFACSFPLLVNGKDFIFHCIFSGLLLIVLVDVILSFSRAYFWRYKVGFLVPFVLNMCMHALGLNSCLFSFPLIISQFFLHFLYLSKMSLSLLVSPFFLGIDLTWGFVYLLFCKISTSK